ncbi:MAG: hypothetical protein C5B55_10550 [Blastocatellia bacterium]|nr:MAG: hypothetical protein C5B55_10550 [Blastocatellia bacterium]
MTFRVNIAAAALVFLASAGVSTQVVNDKTDLPARRKEALIELENSWLNAEHDPKSLDRILAPDFIHVVPTGDFLTKAQHIYYSSKRMPPTNLKHRFDKLTVRIYGDVGIVNGIVITSDENAKDVDRTIFTDVFAYRNGQWQAINAQENKVESIK